MPGSIKSCLIRSKRAMNCFNLVDDPARENNLWDDADCQAVRADMMRALLFGRMGMEPLWMPRIARA